MSLLSDAIIDVTYRSLKRSMPNKTIRITMWLYINDEIKWVEIFGYLLVIIAWCLLVWLKKNQIARISTTLNTVDPAKRSISGADNVHGSTSIMLPISREDQRMNNFRYSCRNTPAYSRSMGVTTSIYFTNSIRFDSDVLLSYDLICARTLLRGVWWYARSASFIF